MPLPLSGLILQFSDGKDVGSRVVLSRLVDSVAVEPDILRRITATRLHQTNDDVV